MGTEVKITLNFSIPETEAVLAGLAKLPLEVSRDLFDRVKADAVAQVQAQQGSDEIPETSDRG